MASYNYSNWYGTPQLDAGDDPYLQNYNYIQQNGTSQAAWHYLMQNWFKLKNRIGVQDQLSSMFGPVGFKQLVGQYAARGMNPQDAAILKGLNLPAQTPDFSRGGSGWVQLAQERGLKLPARFGQGINNPASAAARAQGGFKGDYTYSRYDDGMQHLAQMNDPTWTTLGNPNRGAPVVGQTLAAPVANAVPAQQTPFNRSGGGFIGGGSQPSTATPTAPSTAPAITQPAPVPQVPQSGTNGTIGSYRTNPLMFNRR